MNWIWVFIGGGVGSLCRFIVSKICLPFVQEFPLSTLLSNVFATGILALIVSQENVDKNHWLWYFLALGFCGGFSTFSTFSMENMLLFEQGKVHIMILNVLLSIVLSFGLFYIVMFNKAS